MRAPAFFEDQSFKLARTITVPADAFAGGDSM
ncbi:hypothetical protein V474_24310 [Novosphingobium barchaimii LL02]|uniref:Uncharacterized protein n=1 Tax=Novosphingobium barchaimii LL02 TaxID=1114963 RepID=A0A0J7XLT6_9SPHN|nr:hypothetical protein V474_24310 [Novosphingobium barchaimii LL02]